LDKNVLQIWSPFHICFLQEEITEKNPVILLSSHDTAQEEEVQGRHGGSPQIKPKIFTSYYKFMGGIDSSDMMLYTYLDERRVLLEKGSFQHHSQDGDD
jgi:hypothetical protein